MSITVSTDDIVEIIARHAREVIPRLETHAFKPTDSLKSLGANSIDRADIIMMTLETLALNIPLIHMAKAENIADLARIIHEKA
ncbi:polyketide biosynthesis acyl carrier protein [Pseudoduganella flava]|uniref:Polyketide biosynthesis acyl carrier protein n=1 Tax=Pseudoduganella flava TaxID=871742 RepID=A0A562PHT6_9BURK|nr:acyl carrier protein [Pseudoduganella flava]TWI43994.1 polyketide biosynthesis acyl carrier protein [Pseudoduganella flava]